jgi:hypothetical protein
MRRIEQVITYLPPAAILISAAVLNLTNFERQYLILILIIWGNMFFLYRAWFGQ